MIPARLFVRHFMCYRDNVPPLDFEGFHLACLCGNNGNGKSALIDAITWALWGKSRAKTDDELICLGQNDMQVEFDFLVAKNRYRVIRKRTKASLRSGTGKTLRPGQTSLEFQIAAAEGFKAVSGDSISQTQQRIIDVLHMDYATFINSALLRQGHADEFTIKSAGERKKVLADIMGLAAYDQLEEKARGRAREIEQDERGLQRAIHEMQREINQRGEYEAALGQSRDELDRLVSQADMQESRVCVLREQKRILDFKQEQLAETAEAEKQARDEVKRWKVQSEAHARMEAEYDKVLRQLPIIEEGHARLHGTMAEADELAAKLERLWVLERQKNSLVQAVSDAKGKILEQLGSAQGKCDEMESRAGQMDRLEKDMAGARTRYEAVTLLRREVENRKRTLQELAL
ncbi:MAG: SMC family ATPase, partial [Chloroflexi bacterium]|nr:SMC family ATPase [Chloroflexota bacterium]